MSAFPEYPTYKPTDIEWLGDIPAHWEIKRMKFLFREVSLKNKPYETLLSVTQDKGVIPRAWIENRMVMPSGNLESFKFIEKGDFAISLRSFEGGLEFCYHPGIISPAYTVLKKKDGLNDQYYKYLFKSTRFISEMQTSIVGIREGKNISYAELCYSILPLPPLSEQRAIAAFLDRKTTAIDKAIAQKQRLIELLKERKQIVIQELVTGKWVMENEKWRKRTPAEMKPSGVEWIGEIPVEWEVRRLKYFANKITDGEHISPEFKDSGMPFLSAKDIRDGFIEFPDDKFVSYRDGEKFRKRCNPETGDVLIVSRGATIGRVSKVTTSAIFCLLGSVILIKPNNKIFTDFLFTLLSSKRLQSEVLDTSHHSAQQALYLEKVKEIYLPVPPSENQTQLVFFLSHYRSKIDNAIALAERQVEKLREYKAVLIDGAVRGKVRVDKEE